MLKNTNHYSSKVVEVSDRTNPLSVCLKLILNTDLNVYFCVLKNCYTDAFENPNGDIIFNMGCRDNQVSIDAI